MSLKRIIVIASYILILIVSAVGFYYIFVNSDYKTGLEPEVMLQDDSIIQGAGILLGLTLAMLILAVVITFVVSPIVNVIQSPKASVKAGIGFGVILVVFLIGWAVADSEVLEAYKEFGVDTEAKSKMVGGLLNSVYILLIIGVAVYIYNGVISVIKNN